MTNRTELLFLLALALPHASACQGEAPAPPGPLPGRLSTESRIVEDFAPPAPPPGVRSGHLQLAARSSHPWLLRGERGEVFVDLSIRVDEPVEETRPPLNLALVLDKSGSMGAEGKLNAAKRAAGALVRGLRPGDRLALLAYDGEVRTLVPSRPVDEPGPFLAAIGALEADGSTDLYAGLVTGYEEILAGFDEGFVNRVLLVSDGIPTAGVQDPARIRERAARCLERGVRISALGLGLDYDEDLLASIALEAGGNYGYVPPGGSVEEWLEGEMNELARLVARGVELDVTLGEGVELAEVFGCRHRLEGRRLRLFPPDLYGGEDRRVGLRLRVRPEGDDGGPLLSTSLAHVDVATGEPHRVEGRGVNVAFTDDPARVAATRDRVALARLEVLRNARAVQAAMGLQKDGQFQAAQELIAARYLNSRTLNETEYRDPELERILERMKTLLREIEATRNSPRARRDLQLHAGLESLGYLGY